MYMMKENNITIILYLKKMFSNLNKVIYSSLTKSI